MILLYKIGKGEQLDSLATAFSHCDISIVSNGYTFWSVELSGPVALGTEWINELAILREYLEPVKTDVFKR